MGVGEGSLLGVEVDLERNRVVLTMDPEPEPSVLDSQFQTMQVESLEMNGQGGVIKSTGDCGSSRPGVIPGPGPKYMQAMACARKGESPKRKRLREFGV